MRPPVDEQAIIARLFAALDEAEQKAWAALAGYKFHRFGYWCSIWIHLNRITGLNRPNPWRAQVHLARKQIAHDGQPDDEARRP